MGKILVVDDDHTVLFMLEEVLRDAGHDVVASAHAGDSLDLLEGVDAAIVDCHMPGTGGVDLVSQMHERNAALPVILLTAQSSAQAEADARSAGAFDAMTKPVDIDELSSVL